MKNTATVTALISLVFALTGFSYNAWRLEKSEENIVIREAAFEVLDHLGEFEQVLYARYYDQDEQEGSPRTGWVKIGMISDMSMFVGEEVTAKAEVLKANWAENWTETGTSREKVDALVVDVDAVREAIRAKVLSLE